MTKEKKATPKKAANPKQTALKAALSSSIIDSISDELLVIDPNDYRIVKANQALLTRLKLPEKDVLGQTCYKVTHHAVTPCKPPQDICPVQELLKTGKSVTVEHTHFDKDNHKFYVEISTHPIKNRDGKTVLVTHIAKDITQKKQMQAELLKSERLAVVGELALQLANDLRNPLQAINSATYWFKKECTHLQSSPKGMEVMNAIGDSVKYADKLVEGLLDFASTKKPQFKKIAVNEVVKEAIAEVETTQGITIITELGNLPQIEADKKMLKRVFLNLTVNGIQAMENGGTLRVSTIESKGFVEASFRDTGIGIQKEKLDKLFKPLFSTKSKGMGLGLAISKRLIEAHSGSIAVESEVAKGTMVTVKLPIIQPELTRSSNTESNILVVDNKEDILENVKKLIQEKKQTQNRTQL